MPQEPATPNIMLSKNNSTRIVVCFFAGFFSLLLLSDTLDAAVKGQCAICHTMHNSQNNSAVSLVPDFGGGAFGTVGWNGDDGQLVGSGETSNAPQKSLLVSDCVGCHSSTSDQTIITVGAAKIPIVYNTGGYPSNPLAGGNFYHVSKAGSLDSDGIDYSAYGHNVYGVAVQDKIINEPIIKGAPGNVSCGDESSSSCHYTLAVSANNKGKPGCQGCHYNVFHHKDNGQYRFLNGHEGSSYYVAGNEDPNWEQSPDATHHNEYKGHNELVQVGITLGDTNSISSYCGGCHSNFHRKFLTETKFNIGVPGAWLRHPTDYAHYALPTTGEYGAYDPKSTYSNLAPVAWVTPGSDDKAIVMCLSCHRPHGSKNRDILRWDYDTCDVGTNDTVQAECGCFVCHTAKDDN